MCYNRTMKERKGFTLIEVMIVGVFVTLLVIIFFIQKANVEAMDRDDDRKRAINAMYYALEEYIIRNMATILQRLMKKSCL